VAAAASFSQSPRFFCREMFDAAAKARKLEGIALHNRLCKTNPLLHRQPATL
jgi:hypothetical protein